MVIPEGVTSIGDHAFEDCDGVGYLIIPNSVTSIGEGAFIGCTGLWSITIPEGVTSIEKMRLKVAPDWKASPSRTA